MSNLVVGYTCQDHLLLDLDNIDYWRVERIAKMIQREWPKVGACAVVRSSRDHYHLVYDSRLSWDEIVHIIQTLAALSIVQKEYAYVRTFRRDLTLRVSEKRGVDRLRPVPEPMALLVPPAATSASYGIIRYLRLLNNFIDVTDFLCCHERSHRQRTSDDNRRVSY